MSTTTESPRDVGASAFTRRRSRRLQRISLSLVVGLSLLLVSTACGGSDEETHDHLLDEGGPTTALTTPAPPSLPDAFAGVDQNDPESVLVAAAQTLFSYTPVTDASQAAAADRAAPLIDERFYRENRAGFLVMAPVPGSQWDRWRQQNAVVTARATITADDHPADAPARVSRVVALTQTATTSDGVVVDQNTFAAYMTVTRLGVWRVSAIAVR